MNKEKPETAESDAGPENADEDVVSDPARDAGSAGDWSDEGGATPDGRNGTRAITAEAAVMTKWGTRTGLAPSASTTSDIDSTPSAARL